MSESNTKRNTFRVDTQTTLKQSKALTFTTKQLIEKKMLRCDQIGNQCNAMICIITHYTDKSMRTPCPHMFVLDFSASLFI